MIFLIGVILIVAAVVVGVAFGSKGWQKDNWADLSSWLLFWTGLGMVALSCVIALAKVMP